MIETKKIRLEGHADKDSSYHYLYLISQKYVDDLTAFGWQRIQEIKEREGRNDIFYQLIGRETTHPLYQQYLELEEQYNEAEKHLWKYNKANALTAFILLVLGIIPGVLYIVYKTNQKSKYEKHNNECKQAMKDAVSKAKELKQI